MMISAGPVPLVFALQPQPLVDKLTAAIDGQAGQLSSRLFPDGEVWLRILTPVTDRHCLVVADLSHPNGKYLPLLFLLETLRELGAASVGLVAPYLAYMRQDRRFADGEAVTSRLFARDLSMHMDWLVTVDPHLHRYHALEEIYQVPCRVVRASPALADWLKNRENLLLVGPDAESEQWVADIAGRSGHPWLVAAKQRLGDRSVTVSLPDTGAYRRSAAVIIDDVIASGQTILQCIAALRSRGIEHIECAAVHGIFADGVDTKLLEAGLGQLVTTNTIAHPSNRVDVSPLLAAPVLDCLQQMFNARNPVG